MRKSCEAVTSPFNAAVTSPFSTAPSAASGAPAEGQEFFFPPLPPGEGCLLEGGDQSADRQRGNGAHGEGVEGKENMFYGVKENVLYGGMQEEDEGGLSLPSSVFPPGSASAAWSCAPSRCQGQA